MLMLASRQRFVGWSLLIAVWITLWTRGRAYDISDLAASDHADSHVDIGQIRNIVGPTPALPGATGQDDAKLVRPVALPANFRVHDLDGRQHVLGSTSGCRGVALVFLATQCPISNGHIPRLNKLAESYAKQGIEFFGILSDRSVTRIDAKQHAQEFRIQFPMLFDSSSELREATGATHTPHAFVFDAAGKELYRGAIDDSSPRLGKKTPARHAYLANALQAVVKAHPLAVARTEPVGCLLEEPGVPGSTGDVNFNRHVAPIVFSNCVICHRDGEVAPFALTTFAEVSKRARQIAAVTESRLMPPWKPSPDYSHFAGERRLSTGQIAVLQKWAAGGAPEGDRADLPPLPIFPTGWRLGTPDVIVRMPRPFAIYAEGPDFTQHFVIPVGLQQDRLTGAIEVHPGNSKVVHHAHMFLDQSGQARLLDAADPSEGYTRFGGTGFPSAAYLGGWNPGATPHFFPRGAGRLMPKGGDVVFQIHYHPSGKPEFDQTEIGLYFAPPGARQVIADLTVGSVDLIIPAGNADARFTAEYVTPSNLTVLEIRPHMHLLGKSYEVRGVMPNGGIVPLIKIENWDFDWQDSYAFEPFPRLPAGTRIQILVCYDNSANNPDNPNSPPKTVFYGDESTDEMSNCAIRVTTDSVAELKEVMSDNGRYWSGQIQRYLDRGMTPDKKPRPPK